MIIHIEPSRIATGFAYVTFEDRNGFTSTESIDAEDLARIAAAIGLVVAHPSQLRPPQAADEAAARASVRDQIEWEREHPARYGSHTKPQLSDIQ